MNTLRIATRQSPLALWQAKEVARQLQIIHPGLETKLVKMTTHGDRILDSPLSKIGGKGLFVKELEQGLLNDSADIAVHSIKDVPMELPENLDLPVILPREDPLDAFVSNKYPDPDQLPDGAYIGTSSLRRQAQFLSKYPKIKVGALRGNVGSRLKKLDEGRYDAIILAAAGLKRLGNENRITYRIRSEQILPAVGQGAIGIECRQGDKTIKNLIKPLHDSATATCVYAERAFNRRLNGGCQVPIAAFALLEDNSQLWLRGKICALDGKRIIEGELRGSITEAESLGRQLAETFLARGADKILAAIGLPANRL